MKRTAILKDYWRRPTKNDFDTYNAHIIVDRLHAYYILQDDDNLKMIFPYQIDEIAMYNKVDTKFREIMCKVIDDLPEKVWQQLIKELNFKQYE